MRIQMLFFIMNLISLSMASFQKGNSEESIAFLKELGSPCTRYVKKSSPKDVRVFIFFAPSRFRINYKSRNRRRDISGRRSTRRITKDFRLERKDVFKVNTIPNFNYGVVGYFTDLRVNHYKSVNITI